MKEYIERAALKRELAPYEENDFSQQMDVILAIVDAQPAADVVEVRHGRWLTTDAYPHHLYCSVCYKTYAKNAKWVNELDLPTNYCPNCGARMDKEDDHDPETGEVLQGLRRKSWIGWKRDCGE